MSTGGSFPPLLPQERLKLEKKNGLVCSSCVLLFCSFVKVNAILCDCLLEKSEQDEISHLKWDELLSR